MKIGMYVTAFDVNGYGRFGKDQYTKIKSHGFDAIDYNISDTESKKPRIARLLYI